jgi:threonine aldolase
MARRLESAVRGVEGLTLRRPVQANSVFAVLPAAVTARLQKRFRFYTWDDATGEVRWMTTFDTTEDDVDVFAGAIHEELAAALDDREEPAR